MGVNVQKIVGIDKINAHYIYRKSAPSAACRPAPPHLLQKRHIVCFRPTVYFSQYFCGAEMKLPDSVQEIADVIGRDQALHLVANLPKAYSLDRRWSGAEKARLILYVPTVARLNATHQLVRILGWHDAIKLCKAFGGEIMYPAMCKAVERDERNARILAMLAGGLTPAEVAASFRMTVENVRRIKRENPPQERPAAANDNAPIDDKAHSQR